ncbi:hypothetical protein [Novosphingobium sp. EMRT-2]|uniref:hypothetical protein n=1 Tax=Novosphingobium sp. EMRT-2 TaxID=2571749 RepID=UPI0010BD0A13|nr:hypothetical protein [Novosphingobium sp. EMRT-2]QCI92116.1 hypothetical protein FA702_00045 [Novosphingobium sp. EMRT-2]QCI95154.1 hypothetical protein FA702_17670 [Novosphingobium sp. EMRT-2]
MTTESYRLIPEGSPAFSFKQVEAVLARAFGIADGKRKTFVARLQQLQKLGLPAGTNTGRGSRAAYSTWQICEFQLYLDMLNAGIPPALIAARFATAPLYASDGTGRFSEKMAIEGRAFYMHLRINALDHLSSDSDTTPSADSPTHTAYSCGADLAQVLSSAQGCPGLLIDSAARIRSLREALAIEVPGTTDIPLFQHYADE